VFSFTDFTAPPGKSGRAQAASPASNGSDAPPAPAPAPTSTPPPTEPAARPAPSAADDAYAKRLRVLALAEELGNISEACRIVGVSRRSFYEWKRIAEEQGNEALYPKRAR